MFNLIYRDFEDGKLFKAKRRKDVRGHILESGKKVSHSYMYLAYEYIGRLKPNGKLSQNYKTLTDDECRMIDGIIPADPEILKTL